MFMDQRQYVSMINTNYTQVLVPQFSSTPRYTIHFYAAALHRRNPLFCGMYDSRGNRFFIRWLRRISPHLRVSTMDMWILDRDVIYKCSTYYYAADGTRVSVAREKTLSLKRIKGNKLRYCFWWEEECLSWCWGQVYLLSVFNLFLLSSFTYCTWKSSNWQKLYCYSIASCWFNDSSQQINVNYHKGWSSHWWVDTLPRLQLFPFSLL